MRKIAFLALMLTGMLVGACNTVKGIGRDIQAAGHGVETVSDEARASMKKH
jgi:predicted small secreted protein